MVGRTRPAALAMLISCIAACGAEASSSGASPEPTPEAQAAPALAPQPPPVQPPPTQPPPVQPPPQALGTVSILSLPSVRTAPSDAHVRVRVDNETGDVTRMRVVSAARITGAEDELAAVAITSLQVFDVPHLEVYPTTEVPDMSPGEFVEVGAHASRVFEVRLDHFPRFAPLRGQHTYELLFEREGHGETRVLATLGDGIRHPRRR